MAVRGGLAYGPGVADMKGGLLVGLTAVEALARGPRPFASVELHSVPDEEIAGDPVRDASIASATPTRCSCSKRRENGDFVSGRKTGAWLRLAVEGRRRTPAPSRNAGAARSSGSVTRCCACLPSTARPRPHRHRRHDRRRHHRQRRASAADSVIDVRAPSRAGFDCTARDLTPREYDGYRVSNTTSASAHPPSFSPRAPQGWTSRADERRMSDGCWTAAAGVPTLDGLGPVGGLDHSPSEYILLDSVPSRCGIVARLCTAVGSGLLDDARPGDAVCAARATRLSMPKEIFVNGIRIP